jgi:LmbE family N-acetylglucosaminyl deacetylase
MWAATYSREDRRTLNLAGTPRGSHQPRSPRRCRVVAGAKAVQPIIHSAMTTRNPTPHCRRWRTLLLLLLLGVDPAAAGPLLAQNVVEGDGASSLGVALRQLGTTKRVLMIAAHPDDENTALIAELALGDGADVAYLSLTRGEGGQNLIGPELQEGLGLIRTEELLAARRLDGARQFFSRAYDFGFSKSADETFRHWPRDTILADVVEVVRRFRPDIIISVFSGTPADGHGHHQAAGMLAREAFTAAADAALFPEQFARGLRPHAATHLFQAMYRPPADAALRLATGDLDPLFGRSRYQIAMQSRSRHRSQDMGRAEPLGPQSVALRVLASRLDPGLPEREQSLFAGLDTTLALHARSAGAPADVLRRIEQYERTVAGARAEYNPLRGWQLAQPIASAIGALDSIMLPPGPGFAALRDALGRERTKASNALRQAAGIVVDAVSDRQRLAGGEPFHVTVTLWNGGSSPVMWRDVRLVVPDGWTVRADSTTPGALTPGTLKRTRFLVTPDAGTAPTEAYFLRSPRDGALYRWDIADSLRALPFQPPVVRAVLRLDAGVPIDVEREAEFLGVDKAVGEVRQPLIVVPRANVLAEPRLIVVSSGDTRARSVSVTVTSASAAALSGDVHLDAPAGWHVAPVATTVSLQRHGDSRTIEFTVTPPATAGEANGASELRARFVTDHGTFDRGHAIIDYPHTRPYPLYHDARVRAVAFPVNIATNLRIGYIEGAGDDGAFALRQLGATVEQLGPADLAGADLDRFDAIVAGIRAYEVRADLLQHNQRLLDYARRGGTFIVQYNKYEIVDGGFMPYPATMARPHGRVTDPAAAVTLLHPEHPLLAGPNRITAADFDGWVQERGLYYLASFDDRYTPLLAMADDGEQPLHGGLVAARLGQGWYVYSGLALFRQLPEGVPGAFRLLANLVSLGR